MSQFSDEPITTGGSDRLHNSGWGRPPEQYRTAAVGRQFVVHYIHLISCWPGADDADTQAILAGHVDLCPPRDAIAQYALSVARALGATKVPGRADASSALRCVCARVTALGLTEGMVLTVGTFERYKHEQSKRESLAKKRVSAQQIALVLALLSCSSPPLVLWGREPSLGAFHRKYVLNVKWLRRDQASPIARDAWSKLADICQPCLA